MYAQDDFLQLSGLQHFAFCRRQWALIHIENQWKENLRTVDGDLFHTRVHDNTQRERRGDTLILRGLPVMSRKLGISGQCDAVEFHADANGIILQGEEGLWQPFPIEYKRGAPKTHDADALQLCAQALCLEEMLCCSIKAGALFYGETRKRESIEFTSELRTRVQSLLEEMHQLQNRGYTPRVKPTKSCNACSLKEICLPGLQRKRSTLSYLRRAMEEEP